jgi:flagellar M-ring protein FliF
MPAIDLDNLRSQVRRLSTGFTTSQKVAIGVTILAMLMVGFWFLRMPQPKPYAPLFTNLDPTDAARITDELTARGIEYQLADSGRTVTVPREDVYQLRLDMSAKGLPSGSSNGYALLEKQGITTSEFRQRIDYQRALQGELERTIIAMNGVQGASVHLVVPKRSVFAEDDARSSASVLLKTSSEGSLTTEQVQAIVHLVAASVDGLAPEDVTVADTAGNVLAAPGHQPGSSAQSGDLTEAYERGVANQVRAMLDGVLGPGRSVVAVHATLDFDQRAITNETFTNPNIAPNVPPDPAVAPIPLEQRQTRETLQGTPNGGIVGIDGVQGAGQPGNYDKTDTVTRNAVNRTVEQVQSAPGAVVRQSVAVILDAAHTDGARMAELTEAIAAAAGIQRQRGDVVNVSRMPFKAPRVQSSPELTREEDASALDPVALARTGTALLLVAVLLVLAYRAARRASQYRPDTRIPIDLAQLEGRWPLAIGTGPTSTPALAEGSGTQISIPEQSELASLRSEIAALIERQPEEVAQTLRSWLNTRG